MSRAPVIGISAAIEQARWGSWDSLVLLSPRTYSLALQRERAIAVICYAITLDGAIYGPLLERLERELAALRAGDDVVARVGSKLFHRAGLDLFRHQAHIVFFQARDCCGQVRHLQANVVQTLAAFGDELRDC